MFDLSLITISET
ncbi:hypothetical protein D043_0985A, partial [Vibrio parahaemolyticus EKP-021]